MENKQKKALTPPASKESRPRQSKGKFPSPISYSNKPGGNVNTQWEYTQQVNPAFRQLMALLLKPRNKEAEEKNGNNES